MLIFALDDEPLMLDELEMSIREALPGAELRCFRRASHAITALREEGLKPDVIFSDIEMPGMGGIELAKTMKELSPKSNIVFVTGFPEYALEAVQQHVSGFMVKPATPDKILHEMENLRFPLSNGPRPAIRVQCFGNFEVFANGKPIRFRYTKAKELLAYLVDRRGAALNTAELCAVLWENEPDSPARRSLFRNIVADMLRTLAQNGGGGVVNKGYNQFGLNTDAVDCDLYDYLRQSATDGKPYAGEYMSQYSWAELSLASFFGTARG